MKKKHHFWLLIGLVGLFGAEDVRSQETRGQSANRELNTAGKPNAAKFRHVYVPATNLTGKELLFGTDTVLFHSADGGRAWEKVSVSRGQTRLNVTAVVLDFKQPRTIYVATREAGVFVSSDGGTKWSRINNGLGGLDGEGLAINPNDGKLHAVIRAPRQGIYGSLNGGIGWERVNGDPGQEIGFPEFGQYPDRNGRDISLCRHG